MDHFEEKKDDYLLFAVDSRMLPTWFPNENPVLHLILRKRSPIIDNNNKQKTL